MYFVVLYLPTFSPLLPSMSDCCQTGRDTLPDCGTQAGLLLLSQQLNKLSTFNKKTCLLGAARQAFNPSTPSPLPKKELHLKSTNI